MAVMINLVHHIGKSVELAETSLWDLNSLKQIILNKEDWRLAVTLNNNFLEFSSED